MKFFASNGWLTPKGDLVITLTSWLLMLGPWFLPIPFWLIYTLFCVGVMLGAYIGYEGQAKQAGYPPPFKKDPLGWRGNPRVKSCIATFSRRFPIQIAMNYLAASALITWATAVSQF